MRLINNSFNLYEFTPLIVTVVLIYIIIDHELIYFIAMGADKKLNMNLNLN